MKKLIISIVFLVIWFIGFAQEKERTWQLNGHLQALEDLWISPSNSSWLTMTSIYNRLDFRWQIAKPVSIHIGTRNIFNYGQMIQESYPYYSDIATTDEGLVDMTWLWVKDTSFFAYTNIDRAYIKLSTGKFEATLGRQRINWGVNLVWTPNDIFNAFNYFDFDYVERPGCDAVLMQYYTGMTSSLQFGFKMDSRLYELDSVYNITSALMYRFNKWGYDYQFLGGMMRDDLVLGLGWSGDIAGAGFNGEASYFLDKKELFDTTGVLVASAELNYTLKNSLFLHGAYLFNSAGTTGPAGWGNPFVLFLDISAKNFTKARHSLFAETSYPVTPLIKGSVAAIFNPNDKSGFAGPSVDFSLTNNISLFIIGQIFWGENDTEFGDNGTMIYWRLKWSF